MTGYPRFGNSLTADQILTATLTFAVTCGRSCGPLAVEPASEVSPLEWVPQAGPSRRPRCRHRALGTPAAHCRRRFAHRSGHSRSTAPAVLLMVASPLEYPRPAAGPSRRPRPTGRCRHRAHGTPAAHCRRRFAPRSGHSRSTASAVPATLVPAPVIAPYHCRSSWAAARRRPLPAANAESDTFQTTLVVAPTHNCESCPRIPQRYTQTQT